MGFFRISTIILLDQFANENFWNFHRISKIKRALQGYNFFGSLDFKVKVILSYVAFA